MKVEPYLSYEGRTEEALNFYAKAIGAQVDLMMRFKDAPKDEACEGDTGPRPPLALAEKILHSSFRIGASTIMASDGMCSGKPNFAGVSLSIQAKDDAEAKRIFEALAEGGQIHQPLIKTFFASSFGMLADRFGLGWMIVAGAQP